ncbi:MAG TPA: DUF5615 family PIN-like protein [Solirubrobacteraceae bacterium]|nr:DUF5615 family PIN-like protein [Solirubrobacteraceae bacterium]
MPPPERRRLVLDEDINWKLAAELQRRGRSDATAVVPENLAGTKDAALFKALAAREPFVLVTWDNKMFSAHAAELSHHQTTVAMIDERWFRQHGLPSAEQEPYIRDVVHRWLHRIERLAPGSWRIYSPAGSRSG